MILEVLERSGRYGALNSGFKRAFDFLREPGLAAREPGKIEIDGERLFAIVSKGPGRKRHEGMLETHRKYVDIQYVIAGTDAMGWKTAAACRTPAGEYDPEKDIRFFSDEPDVWFGVKPGCFVIFFPEDAHLPLISAGEVHKVVIKVAVEK